MIKKRIAVLFLSFLVVVSCLQVGYGAELTKLRVGSLITGEFTQAYIAQKKGFFEKYGLAVELIYFQGGSQVIQAMLGGDIPLTVTAGPEGVVAKLQGADIALLAANNPTMAFTLFGTPETAGTAAKTYPLKEGVETVLRNIESTIPKAKSAKAEDLIDDSVLRRLDQSGFIDGLYK
jgi:ABC-type nitrate/sulfonate/bicarbonate transport system substrate-binding protein